MFVRYGPLHSFHDEVVYNGANIDAADIVWCRWMGPAGDAQVFQYYRGRKFWIADVNQKDVPPRLAPYIEQLQFARTLSRTK